MMNGRMLDGSGPAWTRGGGDLVWRRSFSGRREQVPNARRFVRGVLAGTGKEDDGVSIVAELSNNALLHTRSGLAGGWFGVELTCAGPLRIAVADLGGGCRPLLTPASADPDPLATSGRGLLMIAELATGLGVSGCPRHGHTVWADLELPGPEGVAQQAIHHFAEERT